MSNKSFKFLAMIISIKTVLCKCFQNKCSKLFRKNDSKPPVPKSLLNEVVSYETSQENNCAEF